jgi:hypothetical protein
MEEHLGRDLEENEHVYHLDGDASNNDLENLVVVVKKYREPVTRGNRLRG